MYFQILQCLPPPPIYANISSTNKHRLCVDKKPTRYHFCVILYFLLYKLLNMFRANMCPSSGADDRVVFSPRVGIVCVSNVSIPHTPMVCGPKDGHIVAQNMLSKL